MKKPKDDPKLRTIALNPNPKGELKMVGGSLADDWNMRLLNNVGGTVPINHSDTDASNKAITAVCAVEHLRYAAAASVACMGLKVARRTASVTEITGMARARRRRSKR